MTDAPKPPRLHANDFGHGRFKPHGQIELWKEGSVVRLRAEGPFNAESIRAVGVAMAQLFAASPPQGRFVDIMVFTGSVMGTPDAVVAMEAFLEAMTRAKTAPLAVAYVVGVDVEGRKVMQPIFERMYEKHNRRFGYFLDEAQAEAWVLQQLSNETTSE